MNHKSKIINILKSSILNPKSMIKFFTKTKLRKVLSTILAVLVVMTSIRFVFLRPSEVKAADIYLGFNEGYGNSASDTNSTVGAGTITNALWKTEDLCKVGKCLYFDGSGDYVSYSDNANLDMGSGNTVTIEGWFRTPDISSGTRTLVAKEEATGADGGYTIEMNSSGQIRFGIDNDNSDFPSDFVASTAAYDDNKWHHFAAVKDGGTSITLYIDAVSVGTPDTSIQNDVSSDDTFYIGIYNGSTNGWSGFIDEVKVLRTARTAAQVKADYTGETPSRGTSASFGAGSQAFLSDGLVGYWKMDEADWTNNCSTDTALDSSGNANHADSCPSTTGPDPASGKYGNAGDFDGSNDYLNAGSGVSLDNIGNGTNGNGFTIGAWVYNDGGGTYAINMIADKHNTATPLSGWSFYYNRAAKYIAFEADFDGTDLKRRSVDDTVVNSQWNHLVVTWDGSSAASGIRFFVNGQETVYDTATNASGTRVSDASQNFWIGNNPDGYSFDGKIDELRLYNRALSPSEIQALYKWAPGPVVNWKFDENTGSNTNDSSGNGYTGSFNGAPTWTTGKYGSGLSFDGSDDGVYNYNQVVTSYPFTLQAWVKNSINTFNTHVVAVGDKDNQDVIYAISTDNEGDPRLIVGAGSLCSATSSYNNVNDENWHLLTGVFTSNTSRSMYVDGILDHSDTTNCTFSSAVDTVSAGMPPGGAFMGTFYPGLIDQVAVYNYARTQKQIIEDMNAGHPAPGSPVGSPVLWWKFDEGVDNTCSDASDDACNSGFGGTTYDGEGSGHVWTNSGKYEKAVYLDGQADYVSAGDVSFTDSATAMTWSLWINPQNITTIDDIFSKTDSSSAANHSFNIITNDTSSDELNVYVGDGADIADFFTTSNFDLTTGVWQHLVAVYDGTQTAANRLKVYKNGMQISGTVFGAIPASMVSSTTTNLKIGDQDGAGSTGLRSYYDDVKIFTSALTEDQVRLLYNQSSNAALGALSTNASTLTASNSFNDKYCVPGDTTPCNPPVAEWKFDENKGTIANDSGTGGDDTATLTNGPQWILGKSGTALQFDTSATSDDYVAITDTNNLDITSAFTIEAWVNRSGSMTTGAGDFYGIFANDKDANTTPRNGIALYSSFVSTTPGYPQLSVNDTSGGTILIAGAIPITANKWNFLNATFLDSSNTGTISQNTFKTANDTTLTDTPDYTSTSPKIGRLHNNTPDATNDYGDWAGLIDTIRVYNYIRTPAQLAWDYSRGAPIVWLKFDECSGTTVNNSGTNVGYDITGAEITIAPTITIGGGGNENTVGNCTTSSTSWGNGAAGKRNGSIDLDGGDDFISFATNHALIAHNSLGYTNISWGGWFNPGLTPVSDALITRESTSGVGEFRLVTEANGKAQCEIYTAGAWDTTNVAVGANALVNNAWNHVMCVYNGATLKVYVNGQLTGSGNQTGSITSTTNGRLYFGRDRANTATTFFDGQVDEIKIFNYDLTPQLLYREMNDGAVRFGPETGSP